MAGIFIPGNTISLGAQGSGGGAYSPIGASFDAVYTQNLYSDFGVASTAAAIHSVTRASTKYVEDTSGLWTSVSANTLARSNKGALIEESRTNSIRNNSMQGAVVGAPGTLPTNWSISSSVSTNVIGFGQAQGIDYVDLQFVGTTATTFATISFDTTTGIDGLTAQAVSNSLFYSLVGGTLTNVTSFNIRLVERTSGGGTVSNNDGSALTTPTATLVRGFYNVTTSGGGTVAKLQPQLRIVWTNAAAVDFTLRIGWPQLELGAFATSPIRTTSAATTRAADVITIDPKYASLAQGSVYVEWEDVLGITSAARVPFALAIDAANRIRSQIAAATGILSMDIIATTQQVALVSTNPIVANSTYKHSMRWGSNDAATAMTAALLTGVSTDTSCTMPAGSFTIGVGNNALGSAFLNGYLRRLTLYPRKLTDAELGALVA